MHHDQNENVNPYPNINDDPALKKSSALGIKTASHKSTIEEHKNFPMDQISHFVNEKKKKINCPQNVINLEVAVNNKT